MHLITKREIKTYLHIYGDLLMFQYVLVKWDQTIIIQFVYELKVSAVTQHYLLKTVSIPIISWFTWFCVYQHKRSSSGHFVSISNAQVCRSGTVTSWECHQDRFRCCEQRPRWQAKDRSASDVTVAEYSLKPLSLVPSLCQRNCTYRYCWKVTDNHRMIVWTKMHNKSFVIPKK